MMSGIGLGALLAIASAFGIAVSGLVLRPQAHKMPAVVMNGVRSLTATGFFWVLLLFATPLKTAYAEVTGTEWFLLIGAVLIGPGIGETSYLRAIGMMGVSRTLAVAGSYPLATLTFEHLLLGEPLRAGFLIGACLVVSGIVCLSGRTKIPGDMGEGRGGVRLGVLLALVASTLWGVSTVMLKPAIQHLAVVHANSVRMPLVSLVLCAAFFGRRTRPRIRDIEPKALWIVAVTGVLSMGLGSLMFLHCVDLIGPAKTATLTSIAPVFSLALGIFFGVEKITRRLLIGVVLCVVGVGVVL